MQSEKPRIGISIGDINGIGPEVALRSAVDPYITDETDIVLVGPAPAIDVHAGALSIPTEALDVADVTESSETADPNFGAVEAIAGDLSMRSVQKAVELVQSGELDALATAPISKAAISLAGYGFPGHTEYLGHLMDTAQYAMMMVSAHMRVVPVTIHIPLRDVAATLTHDLLLDQLRIVTASLQRDFGVADPRIAVLGLNPHAGDEGVLGSEEAEVIRPALRSATDYGIRADGPFPADAFFGRARHLDYDAVLSMYHDQGLIPFKAQSRSEGVNFTAGLPIVRTSPDHGTAFDIAGSGNADPGSMKEAIRLAVSIARHRSAAPSTSS